MIKISPNNNQLSQISFHHHLECNWILSACHFLSQGHPQVLTFLLSLCCVKMAIYYMDIKSSWLDTGAVVLTPPTRSPQSVDTSLSSLLNNGKNTFNFIPQSFSFSSASGSPPSSIRQPGNPRRWPHLGFGSSE